MFKEEILLKDILKRVKDYGATSAEVSLGSSDTTSVEVRMGEIEKTEKKIGGGVSGRVFYGKKRTSFSTSDLSIDSVDKLIKDAVSRAKVAESDPYAGLADKKYYFYKKGDLKIYSRSVERLTLEEMTKMALACERAAFKRSKLITNSYGAGIGKSTEVCWYANSFGYSNSYKSSNISLGISPIAEKDGDKFSSSWFSSACSVDKLSDPASIGIIAADRSLRMLGARGEIKTGLAPVIFDNHTASSLAELIAEAVSGTGIYKKASFLSGKLNKKIGTSILNIIDDGRMIGGVASTPFDGNGIPTTRTVVIQKGVLRNYLTDIYSARRLRVKLTGNGSGGGAEATNFYIKAGDSTPKEMIASVKNGLYVTELIGFGVDMTTGDFSKGASGLWIKDGRLTFPVKELTIAGNLKHMLAQIEMVGNDIEFMGPINSPALKFREMAIGGK